MLRKQESGSEFKYFINSLMYYTVNKFDTTQ